MVAIRRTTRVSRRTAGETYTGGLGDETVWIDTKTSEEDAVSVYKVIDIIGTSSQSWEDAASVAVKTAAGTIRDMRVAEVVERDLHLDEAGGITFRTKLRISFKYNPES